MKWWNSDIVWFLFVAFCVATCTTVTAIERACMERCKRPVMECEQVCNR